MWFRPLGPDTREINSHADLMFAADRSNCSGLVSAFLTTERRLRAVLGSLDSWPVACHNLVALEELRRVSPPDAGAPQQARSGPASGAWLLWPLHSERSVDPLRLTVSRPWM